MPIRCVALIFDDRIRPDTTGVYVRRALGQVVEAVPFAPEQAEAATGRTKRAEHSEDDKWGIERFEL